jgi:hypothetical protein
MPTLEELQKLKTDLQFHINQAATAEERQKLADLQNEVTADRKRVKELNAEAYAVALTNQKEIKFHLAEIEKLRLQSIDLDMDAFQLENGFRTKQQEMFQLEKAIKDKQIVE